MKNDFMSTTRLSTRQWLALGIVGSALSVSANAKISAADAAKLGDTLTPIGAEKAGNADGTIPAWDGGMTSNPACHKPDILVCNPYAEEKPLFTITSDNYEQYKDKLSDGHIAMFKKYKNFKMRIFPTHRPAALPEKVLKDTKINATTTTLSAGGNGIQNYAPWGVPFPIPQSGVEVVWNHIMRYRGGSVQRLIGQAAPQANGSFTMVMFQDKFAFRPLVKGLKPGEDENILFYFKQEVKSPARLAGNVLLVHETIDQVKEPRNAWLYNAGQRRVRRAPQVAYDGPGTAADGLRTTDNFDMYNGSPDRYDWKLVGKRELYIPYNSYELESKNLKYKDIIKPKFINQDLSRYELHRVWEVEATLKPGTRHVYGARTLYIDEDSWQASVIDIYDGRKNLWRVQEAHNIFFYHKKVPWYAVELSYDLQNGRYWIFGLENEESDNIVFDAESTKSEWQPQALRRAGRR